MSCPTVLCSIADHTSWRTFDGGAFDGTYIYVVSNDSATGFQNGIRRIPLDGSALSTLWTDASTANHMRSPTVDEVGKVLYWTRINGANLHEVMAYDLTQGVGGTATVLFTAAVTQEVVPIRFHATDRMIYGVTDGGPIATSALMTINPATGAASYVYTRPAASGRLVVSDPTTTTTPGAVWGLWALEDAAANIGLWRWDLAGAAMTFFNPVPTTSGGSREAGLGLIGLSDETVVTTWLHNLTASASVETQVIVMRPDFSWSVVCDPGTTTPPFGNLDATAPGWRYVVMADTADTHVLRYPGDQWHVGSVASGASWA